MEQFKDNDWDEHGAERDAAEFLEIKKSIFLEDFSMYAHLFDDDGDDDGEGEIADAKKKDIDEDGEDDDGNDDE
jgi:hypothetical protein